MTQTNVRLLTGRIFESGDKNGRLLANLVAEPCFQAVVTELISKTGVCLTDPEAILWEFYVFVSELSLPNLPPEEIESLDTPLSTPEIELAIVLLPPSKTPGPDGLPGDWYKRYAESLATKLQQLFSQCLEDNSLLPSMYSAHIILITKPGKDQKHCAFYRPISLLNYDLKILAKVLATRLVKVLPELVHIDFMPGKSTDIILRRVLTHLQLPNPHSKSHVMVALDIEKAFEMVTWIYMVTVLQAFGFGPSFRKWIDVLYKSPIAPIKLGVLLSEPFPVERGTRQGCPLSPFLFALAMEPLATALRRSDSVKGIRVGSIVEKLALYADDLMLFLNYPGLLCREHTSGISGEKILNGFCD